jgi:hypothetical protein
MLSRVLPEGIMKFLFHAAIRVVYRPASLVRSSAIFGRIPFDELEKTELRRGETAETGEAVGESNIRLMLELLEFI